MQSLWQRLETTSMEHPPSHVATTRTAMTSHRPFLRRRVLYGGEDVSERSTHSLSPTSRSRETDEEESCALYSNDKTHKRRFRGRHFIYTNVLAIVGYF